MATDLNATKQLEFLQDIVDKYVVDPSSQKLATKLIIELKQAYTLKIDEKSSAVDYQKKYEKMKKDYEDAISLLTPKKLVELQMKRFD